jgi:hypothetical protein
MVQVADVEAGSQSGVLSGVAMDERRRFGSRGGVAAKFWRTVGLRPSARRVGRTSSACAAVGTAVRRFPNVRRHINAHNSGTRTIQARQAAKVPRARR